MIDVTLNLKKAKPILCGHPWVFPKAISSMSGIPKTGDLVRVILSSQQFIGIGVYNTTSLYRVRMLTDAREHIQLDNFNSIIEHRLQQAKKLREQLGLPNKNNTAYRFFNSEGDGLSGLTIDIYEDIAVVSSSAHWVELQRNVIETILSSTLALSQIIWKPIYKSLQQDGLESKAVIEMPEVTREVLESGLRYQVQFQHMQKTGLFLDQRENHERIAALCRNKRVLDLYCYTGGFALHAAKAGAAEVTAIDSSPGAIHTAKANAELNQLEVNFQCGDVTKVLSQAENYDIVILDPPKFAPSRHALDRATRMYHHLHKQVFSHLLPNTLLFTCSCSSAMQWDLFFTMLNSAAMASNKRLQCLGKFSAASDHPTLPSFSEGEYLRTALLRVE